MTLRAVGLGLAVLAAVPFVVTGMVRLLPLAEPLLPVPFLLITVAGIALLLQGGLKRAAGVGLLAGAALWGLFLLWLFAQFGGLDRMG